MSKKVVDDSSPAVESPSATTVPLGAFIIAGIVIIAVIIAALTFYQSSEPETFVLNGFQFVEDPCTEASTCYQTVVATNVGERVVTFYTDPRTASDALIQQAAVDRVLAMRANGSLYISFDEGVPGSVGISMIQFGLIVGERLYNIPTSNGVYGDEVTCASSTRNFTVVYFRQDESDTVVLTPQGCVLINAESPESLRTVTDAFNLHLLGII